MLETSCETCARLSESPETVCTLTGNPVGPPYRHGQICRAHVSAEVETVQVRIAIFRDRWDGVSAHGEANETDAAILADCPGLGNVIAWVDVLVPLPKPLEIQGVCS